MSALVKEWYLLLKRYIEAESILNKLDNYRKEQRENIISSHYSSYDEEIEKYTSVSAENTAIRLVSLDNSIDKAKKRCIKRIGVLNIALNTLTYEEFAAFERVAWGVNSYIPKRYERRAIEKVYGVIAEYENEKERAAQATEVKGTRSKAEQHKEALGI